ncbi:MAG: tripartite tricarboxylate transporter substrate binding protein [Candidatus Brocadiia bacterium]
MKNIRGTRIIMTSILVFVGLIASAALAADFPGGKPITFIVPWAAGGANDLGVRALAPYLEKELGTKIAVVNKPGADGWVSYLDFISKRPDGYTISAVNAFMNLLRHNPSSPHKEGVDDYQLLACQVQDISAIIKRADDKRFGDFKGLVEYAKKNEVTASINAFGSEDWMVLALMNKELGTKFVPIIHADGSAQSKAALLGAHVDLISNNASTVYTSVADGSMTPLVVFNSTRSAFFPNALTYKEVTGTELISSSARGLMMPKGGDPKVVKILVDAAERAIKNPEHVARLKSIGLEAGYLPPEGFRKLFLINEDAGRKVNDLLKWNIK